MINLNTGINQVYLTLTENLTSGYTPIFYIDGGEDQIYFTATNTSNYTERYDRYTWIINSGDTNLTGGTIDLDNGFFDYVVYEKSEVTIDDLNKDAVESLTIIERGKVKKAGSNITEKYYKSETDSELYYKK